MLAGVWQVYEIHYMKPVGGISRASGLRLGVSTSNSTTAEISLAQPVSSSLSNVYGVIPHRLNDV